MPIFGFGQTARKTAKELTLIWSHLPEEDRTEQVEWHLESEGFSADEIDDAMEFVGLSCRGEYEIVFVAA